LDGPLAKLKTLYGTKEMTFENIPSVNKLALIAGLAVGFGAAALVNKLETGAWLVGTSLTIKGVLENLAFYALVFGLIAVARSDFFKR
jgi:hypothetical protein